MEMMKARVGTSCLARITEKKTDVPVGIKIPKRGMKENRSEPCEKAADDPCQIDKHVAARGEGKNEGCSACLASLIYVCVKNISFE